MENDEKSNEDVQKLNEDTENKNKLAEGYKETKHLAEQGLKLAASVSTGNVGEAIKSGIEIAKSKMVKKKIKRNLMMICAFSMAIIILACSLLGVFEAVKQKIQELLSSIKKALASFWRWITDDYWIKLDDEIEYTTTTNTRPANNQKR